MSEENVSHIRRMKNIDETRNYCIKEINQNGLISKKHKKVCKVLNYIEYLLILIYTGTRCVSISAIPSLVGITSSAVGIKIYVITAGIKKYKSLIKKRKRSIIKLYS